MSARISNVISTPLWIHCKCVSSGDNTAAGGNANTAVQRQTAVTGCFSSEQLLLFAFAGQNTEWQQGGNHHSTLIICRIQRFQELLLALLSHTAPPLHTVTLISNHIQSNSHCLLYDRIETCFISITLWAGNLLFKFSPTWSCVSLTRPTTSRAWKFTILQ